MCWWWVRRAHLFNWSMNFSLIYLHSVFWRQRHGMHVLLSVDAAECKNTDMRRKEQTKYHLVLAVRSEHDPEYKYRNVQSSLRWSDAVIYKCLISSFCGYVGTGSGCFWWFVRDEVLRLVSYTNWNQQLTTYLTDWHFCVSLYVYPIFDLA